MDHVPRIAPLASPYEAEIATALAKWMPPGSAWEPLKLFRTLYRNPEISSRMRALGVGILGSHSSLDPHEQEILIDRTVFAVAVSMSGVSMLLRLVMCAGCPARNWRIRPAKPSMHHCRQSASTS